MHIISSPCDISMQQSSVISLFPLAPALQIWVVRCFQVKHEEKCCGGGRAPQSVTLNKERGMWLHRFISLQCRKHAQSDRERERENPNKAPLELRCEAELVFAACREAHWPLSPTTPLTLCALMISFLKLCDVGYDFPREITCKCGMFFRRALLS